jgi:hypothetical protein
LCQLVLAQKNAKLRVHNLFAVIFGFQSCSGGS